MAQLLQRTEYQQTAVTLKCKIMLHALYLNQPVTERFTLTIASIIRSPANPSHPSTVAWCMLCLLHVAFVCCLAAKKRTHQTERRAGAWHPTSITMYRQKFGDSDSQVHLCPNSTHLHQSPLFNPSPIGFDSFQPSANSAKSPQA